MRRLALVLAAGIAALAAASPASAASNTYCVSDPSCPQGGVVEPDLATAVSAATDNRDADVIRLGPGSTFTGTGVAKLVALTRGDTLRGAGSSQTTLNGALQLTNQANAVGLTVKMGSLAAFGVNAVGGTLTDVDVDGTGAGQGRNPPTGLLASGGAVYRGGAISMTTGTGVGSSNTGAPMVTDSTISAPTGVSAPYGMQLSRVEVDASAVGVSAPSGGVTLDAVAVRPEGAGAAGVVVGGAAPGTTPTTTLNHVTIAGNGISAGTVGLAVRAACAGTAASATGTEVAITGVSTAVERKASCASGPAANADLVLERSAYDSTAVVSGGAGAAAMPDPVTGDLKLDVRLVPMTGSPLVDAGDPAEAAGLDLFGHARPADGDGDGIAVSDIGATELGGAPGTGGVGGIGDAYTDFGSYDFGDYGDYSDFGDSGVLGESDSSAKRKPKSLKLKITGPDKRHPRRLRVTVTLGYPSGTSPKGGVVTLALATSKKTMQTVRGKLDKRGRATLTLRLPADVARKKLGVKASFKGTKTLKALTGKRVAIK